MNTPGTLVALLVLGTLSAVRAAAGSRRRSTVHGRLGPALTRTHGGGVGPGPGRWADSVPPLWLGARLEQAGLTVGAATVWRWWLAGAGALTLVGLWVGGPAAGLVGAGASATGPMVAWRLLRHGGHRALEAALPAAVDEVARGLRSGASLRQALAEAGRATPGPLGLDLSQVAAAAEHGASLGEALESWAGRRPLPAVRLVVAALGLGAEAGGAQAGAIDGVASTLRQRLAAQAEARALATQARASAAVIALAPLAFCALASATDPRTSRFLLRDPIGLACLASGLALDAVGALWMARLTRIET